MLLLEALLSLMLLMSLLGLFFLFAARRINQTGHQAMMLQASNRSLIDYLNRARSDAEALNEKLAQEIYERKEARDGRHYFNLKAANHQVIGTSQMYAAAASCEKGIASVKSNGSTTEVKDKTGA